MRSNETEELIEKLSEIEHRRWAHWQRYLHSKCIENNDGSLTIPKELVKRWRRQMQTDYTDLTEDEKKSDREQVMEYLPYILDFRKNNDHIL